MITLYERLGRPADASRYRRLALAVEVHQNRPDSTVRINHTPAPKSEIDSYRRTSTTKRRKKLQ